MGATLRILTASLRVRPPPGASCVLGGDVKHVAIVVGIACYAFGVGQFNFAISLATSLCMVVAYRRHGGRLFDDI